MLFETFSKNGVFGHEKFFGVVKGDFFKNSP
jgi:hypothetical protein